MVLLQSNFRSIKKFFFDEAEKYNKHQEAESNITSESEDWLDLIFQRKTASNLESEIKSYLQEPTEDKNIQPLEYWLLKKDIYPTLSFMAKKFQAVPSTSTPAERAFSSGRLLVHHTRVSMSDTTIRARMCMHNWLLQGYC